MRIFVDVDDTLVLWEPVRSGPHPYGTDSTGWAPNVRLIEGLLQSKEAIIVWSGGGREYAAHWVKDLGLDFVDGVLEKNKWTLMMPCEGDVVIDDMPVIGRTHEPHEWPEE